MALAQNCPRTGLLHSNTILAAIPPEMSLQAAKHAFANFGQISSMEVLSGPSPAVSVAYFDVRCATKAMQALGGPKYCRPGPPSGDRSVRLSGEYNLSQKEIEGVASLTVSPDDENGSSYRVVFYDIRDAHRVRSASAAAEQLQDVLSDLVEPPPGLEHLSPPPGLPQRKASAESKGLKDVTNMPPALRAAKYTIKVDGLPNQLLGYALFEATLQQAGFQASVNRFSTQVGQPCGSATIELLSFEAAQDCMAHFQGRKWDNSGKQVCAWLLNDPSMLNPRRKRCDTGTTVSTDVGGPSDGEEQYAGA